MTIETSKLKCDTLFELSQSDQLLIPPEVKQFLLTAEYPWAALGKNLTNFITACIEKIPPKERIKGQVSPKAYLESEGDIVICEGAVVEAGAYISGPTFIGPGAVVRHGAYVRGSVYVCAKAVVGHTSELKGALLLPLAKAAHFAYVGDSILGYDANLGAGTKLANLRLDHGLVQIPTGTERVDTGLKKFGAIFGNRSQTGCNAVTMPGTILLPDAFVLPNSNGRAVVKKR